MSWIHFVTNTAGTARSVPGLPPAKLDPILDRLWNLTYIKHNFMRTTILMLPVGITVEDAVNRAKLYCKEKTYNFSWLEKAITQID